MVLSRSLHQWRLGAGSIRAVRLRKCEILLRDAFIWSHRNAPEFTLAGSHGLRSAGRFSHATSVRRRWTVYAMGCARNLGGSITPRFLGTSNLGDGNT